MTGDKRKSAGDDAAQKRARAARRAGDETRFWRVPRFDDLDCLAARFETYEFSMHAHDTYGLAVILDGASRYSWRGTSYLAPAGSGGAKAAATGRPRREESLPIRLH